MKLIYISPVTLMIAFVMGLVSAYLAYRRDRNPYLWFAIGFLSGCIGILAFFFLPSKKKVPQPVKREPVFSIQGPTDKFWYYLDPNHMQQGPMSRDALSSAWKEGKLHLGTFVWNEDMPEWKPLKDTLKVES